MKKKRKALWQTAIALFIFSIVLGLVQGNFNDNEFLNQNKALIGTSILIITALVTTLLFLDRHNEPYAKKVVKKARKILHVPDGNTAPEKFDPNDPDNHLVKKYILEDVIATCREILKDDLISQIAASNDSTATGDAFIVPEKNRFDNVFEYLRKEVDTEEEPDKNFQLFSGERDFIHERHAILIIGEPGNGKTCYLAKWILGEAERIQAEHNQDNFSSRIPVFISLGNAKLRSWDVSSLEEWAGKNFYERARKKNFTEQRVVSLMQHYALIPVLDGLDEVSESCRYECFESICGYAGKKNSLIFSCRINDFNPLLKKYITEYNLDDLDEEADEDVKIQADELKVIEVFKLKTIEDNVKEIIRNNIPASGEVITYLDKHDNIVKYIRTPLFLNLFLFVYRHLPDAERQQLAALPEEEFQVKMFIEFEKRMYTLRLKNHNNPLLDKRKNAAKNLTPKEKERLREERSQAKKEADEKWRHLISDYLMNISNRISVTKRKSFFVEDIQPVWLDKPGRTVFYYIVSRMISGFFLSVAIGFFIAGPTDFIGNGVVASIVVALLTMKLNKHKKPMNRFAVVMLFVLSTCLVTLLYQGFVVKRNTHDMFLGIFSVTESFSGVILGLLFGAIFGYRKGIQNREKDIQPVVNKSFKFDVKKAVKTGFWGGTCVGLVIAVCAILLKLYGLSTTFYRWFDNLIQVIVGKLGHITYVENSFKEYAVTFLFAFVVVAYIGFVVFGLLAGRDEKPVEDEPQDGRLMSLNYGIKQSLSNSVKYGFIVFFFMTLLYLVLMYIIYKPLGIKLPEDAVERSFMIGAGFGVISSLWFGGFEYIQHWTLRCSLFFWNVIPLNIDRWVGVVQDLSFMKKIGSGLDFYHDGLKNYYLKDTLQSDNIAGLNKAKRKRFRYLFAGLLAGFIVLLLIPLVERAMPALTRKEYHFYWEEPDEIYYSITTPSKLKPVRKNTFVVEDAKAGDTIVVYVSGKVHAGTFTGNVTAGGAKTGFLGLPLNIVYNIDTNKNNNHCALLYKVFNKKSMEWHTVTDDSCLDKTYKKGERYLIPAKPKDTLLFCVNDNEWENNSGHFLVTAGIKN